MDPSNSTLGYDLTEEDMIRLASQLSLNDEAAKETWNQEDHHQLLDALSLMEDILSSSNSKSPQSKRDPKLFEITKSLTSSSSTAATDTNDTSYSLSLSMPPDCVIIGDWDPDVITAIAGKLYWYQRKLKRAIEFVPSNDVAQMQMFIELNDRVAEALIRTDQILLPTYQPHSTGSTTVSESGPRIHSDAALTPGSSFTRVSPCVTMASIISSLRRGDRLECLRAAGQLVNLCASGGERRTNALRDMRSAGALPILLSAIARSIESQWPDTEIQISKVVSLLVTYEDDSGLLLRSAYEILSTLHMLQIKSSERTRSRNGSNSNFPDNSALEHLGTIHVSHDNSLIALLRSSSASGGVDASLSSSAVPRSLPDTLAKPVGTSTPISEESPASSRAFLPSTNPAEVSSDVRISVAAALAKLSMVLSKEWSKASSEFSHGQTSPDGFAQHSLLASSHCLGLGTGSGSLGLGSGQGQIFTSAGSSESGYNSLSSGIPGPVGCGSSGGLKSFSHEYSADEGDVLDLRETRFSRRSNSGANSDGAVAADTTRTLEIVLNIINTACLQDEHTAPSVILPSTPLSGASAPLQGLSDPRPLSTMYFASADLLGGGVPQVDLATVLYSCALRNLAGVMQCKASLIQGNVLRLLKLWLDYGTMVLTDEMKCLAATTDDTASSAGSTKNAANENSKYGNAHELMSNAATAVMLIVGRTLSTVNHGDESIMGWVDAMVVREALPITILNFIHAGLEDFTTAPSLKTGDSSGAALSREREGGAPHALRSVLPRTAARCLAKTLHQLCRRHYERQHMLALSVPSAICSIFVSIATPTRMASTVIDGWPLLLSDMTASKKLSLQELMNFLASNPIGNSYNQNLKQSRPLSYVPKHAPSGGVTLVRDAKKEETAELEYVAAVSFACLDGLHYFLKDAVSTSHAANTGSEKVPPPIVQLMCHARVVDALKAAISFLPRCKARLSALHVIRSLTEWPSSLVALFEGDLTDALVFISSEADELKSNNRPDNSRNSKRVNTSGSSSMKGRSSALLGMPPSLKYNTINASPGAAKSLEFRTADVAPPSGAWAPLSLYASTGTSSKDTASSIAAAWISTPTAASFHNATLAQHAKHAGLAATADILSLDPNYVHVHSTESAVQDNPELLEQLTLTSAQVSEETLVVSAALANISQANEKYALRMFHNNLMAIMLRLRQSGNPEISRHALRCISAMCAVVALDPAPKEAKDVPPAARQRRSQISSGILAALGNSLESDNVLLQKEAVVGIAALSRSDEQLKDAVVSGPLRKVMGLMVDPRSERELRLACEQVLIASGFSGGEKDFQMCFYDFQILKDWFDLKRSLKPQALGHRMVLRWVDHLFSGVTLLSTTGARSNPAGNGASGEGKQLSRADRIKAGILDLAKGAAKILSMSPPNDVRGMLDWGKSKSTQARSSSPSAGTNNDNAAAGGTPHLQRHFKESIMRYLPFSLSKNPTSLPRDPTQQASESSNRAESDMTPSPTGSTKSSHFQSSSPQTAQFFSRYMQSAASSSGSGHDAPPYDGLDIPPPGVLDLLDHFFPSKIHKLVMLDLLCLGCGVESSGSRDRIDTWTDDGEDHRTAQKALLAPSADCGDDVGDPYVDHEGDSTLTGRWSFDFGLELTDGESHLSDAIAKSSPSFVYFLPTPPEIRSILLPARNYMSFSRVARVVERMIFDGGSGQQWSLAFRDSAYHGDFHETLLATLRRMPQIVSLTFLNSIPQEDTHLGYLAGHIPDNVRFVSFQGSLSRESIQALCIYLLSHNASFKADECIPVQSQTPWHENDDVWELGRYSTCSSKDEGQSSLLSSRNATRKGLRGKGGLYGLAITGCSIDQTEAEYIKELLIGREQFSALKLDTVTTGHDAQRQSTSSPTPNIPSGKRGSISCGLRLLDLSFNRLSDSVCADLLRCTAQCSLTALELGGNFIHRGAAFISAFVSVLGGDMSRDSTHPVSSLKHLGLSYNAMSSSCVCAILDAMKCHQSSTRSIQDAMFGSPHGQFGLTSLDLSNNELQHSIQLSDSLRGLLKSNDTLRVLDLSNNKLTADSIKSVHLGMAENHAMLMLSLAGNPGVAQSSEFAHIQSRLSGNRELYKDLVEASQALALENKKRRKQQKKLRKEQKRRLSEKIDLQLEMENRSPELGTTAGKPPTCSLRDVVAESHGPSANSVPAGVSGDESERITHSSSEVDVVDRSQEGVPISRSAEQSEVVASPPEISMPHEQDHPVSKNPSTTHNEAGDLSEQQESTLHQHKTSAAFTSPTAAAVHVTSSRSPLGHQLGLYSASRVDAPGRHLGLQESYAEYVKRSHATSKPGWPIEPHYPVEGRHLRGMVETTSTDSFTSLETSSMTHDSTLASLALHNSLHVFFSAPLAWRDRTNKLHSLEALDYNAERDSLVQVFREVSRSVSVKFNFATTDSLRTALSFGCRALHFSGHGHPQCLNFEDGRSGLQLVTVESLRALLGAGGLNLDFVFVSACHSLNTGGAFVEAGVRHVVCVKVDAQIQDSAAVSFTRAFYVALLSGRTVQSAFDIAREALKASPYVPDSLLEGEKFILLPEVGSLCADGITRVSHDVPVFSGRPQMSWPIEGQCVLGPPFSDHSADCPGGEGQGQRSLPPPPIDFEGREVDMHRVSFDLAIYLLIHSSLLRTLTATSNALCFPMQVITTILTRRLVSLVGDEGVGKSALAAASCTYIADRGMFEQGVLYLRAHHISSHARFLRDLERVVSRGHPLLAARLRAHGSRTTPAPSTEARYDTTQKPGEAGTSGSSEQALEEVLIAALSPYRVLLLIDNLDMLLSESIAASDFKFFLGELFGRSKNVKVIITACTTLGMRHVSGFGVVENCVTLGPLTLRNTLRLFARLAPSLVTAENKAVFVNALLPLKHMHVTVDSRELSVVAAQILAVLGNGHPVRVVKLACESTEESVALLQAHGEKLASSANQSLLGVGSRGSVRLDGRLVSNLLN